MSLCPGLLDSSKILKLEGAIFSPEIIVLIVVDMLVGVTLSQELLMKGENELCSEDDFSSSAF